MFTKDAPRYIRSKRNKKAVREAYGNEVRIFETSIPEVVALSELCEKHAEGEVGRGDNGSQELDR